MSPVRSRLYRCLIVLLCFCLFCTNAVPVWPMFTPVYAETVRETLTDDTNQPTVATSPQPQVEQVQTGDTPPLLSSFPAFPSAGQTDSSLTTSQAGTTLIRITDAGFDPPTLSVFGPTDVTWVNETAVTHTLRSGEPGTTPGSGKIFLPLITKGSPSAVAAAMTYLEELRRQANNLSDFSATLAPGQSFTYRFTGVGQHKFHLATAPQFSGQLTLSGTAILRTSPSNGEDGVASTRETILEFSGALDLTTVTANAFTAKVGAQTLDYRLNLSPDRTRVTLFYKEALPGSTRVRVTIDGNQLKDAQGNGVDVDGDGTAGGNALLEFDTLSLTVVPGTKVCGRVFASELAVTASNVSVNTPLAGVKISVAGRDADLKTTTDANGNFCLDPAPSGRFFVHIDGRAATNGVPAGAYYPFVGKLWQSTPGQQTSVGDAYLPLVVPGTLQTVSADADTLITFPAAVLQGRPEFEGVMITVPANALFNDDGSRGGKVGIAPVPPDRLPGRLPEGLNFPVVITVQTDGAENFDTPAPVCFPNLPDKTTGQPLPAGSKSALWSFDHDKGDWTIVGPMTVSADGKMVCSDAGIGIRAPGWHGSQPGTVGSGGNPEDTPLPPEICQPPRARPEHIPEDGANGCGAKGDWKSHLIPNDPVRKLNGYLGLKDTSFLPACNAHDICWGTCREGVDAETHKAQCDQEFEDNMLLICKRLDEPLTLPWFIDCLAYSQIYSAAVRAVQEAYDSAQREACVTCNENSRAFQKDLAGSRFFFAIVNINTAEIVNRGQTDSDGPIINSITLAPNTEYQLSVFQIPQMFEGDVNFTTPSNGLNFKIPAIKMSPSIFWDLDKDGLTDSAEGILGTDLLSSDTDSDGIPDGAEVDQGTNPLDGFAAQTGIIGSADTPGTAVDLCVTNDLAVIADGDKGVAIFNIFDNKNPTLVAQVDTPGNAQRVACADGYVAVADDSSGVAVIDIRQVAAARIVQQVTLNGKVTAVAMAGNTVYVGDETGRVVALDPATGAIKAEQNVSVRINDLALAGDYLYLLANDNKLHVLHPQEELRILNTLATPAAQGANLRLFVGTGVAYTTHNRGYNSYNLATPEQPTLIAEGRTDQFGWRQMVSNGAGEGVAIVGVNSNSNRNVLLYDTTDPAQTNAFLTQFDTPGDAQAVVLYKGQAYVADGQAGLQVINYLSYDSQRTAPTLSLTSPFAGDRAEENKLTRFTAVVNDDVQVRQVEFYIDGVLAATDGSYPFEHRLVTPRMTNQASFTLRVRAVDTGGNEQWSDQQTLTLVPDATAPRIIGYAPANATNPADSVRAIAVTFSEAINQSTLTADTLKLFAAGADNLLNTADDTLVTGGTLAFGTQSNQASLTFGSPLSAGIYRAIVSTAISDPAGNRLAADFAWEFGVGQRIPIGSIIAGEISVAGEQDVYNFVATARQWVYFDDQNASRPAYFYWKLQDSSGKQIFQDTIDGSDPGAHLLELGGNYTLTIWGYRETTGAYQFQLRSNPPDTFAIDIGAVIKNGQPGAGAGNIELPGNGNKYTFVATANQWVYFDDQNSSRSGYFAWDVYDPSGKRVFLDYLDDNDPGAHQLTLAGEYTIYTWAYANVAGTYQFQLRSNPPDTFAINIGDVIQNGQPGPGAGNIELPGNGNKYTFNATANQWVYFDDQNSSRSGYFAWDVYDPSGKRVFLDYLDGNDPGAHQLTLAGEYTIYTWAYANVAGTYQFQLRSNPPDTFAINIGDVVRDGQPGVGAGNIELPGNTNKYTFNATVNQWVYFDDQNSSRSGYFAWDVYDPSGKRVFFDYLDDNDPGAHQLTIAGEYTIYTWAYANVAGTYQFQLRSNPADTFAINIGDVVRDGQPGAGAGNIELPGNTNQYTFNAIANQRVYFDDQNASRPGYFAWDVYDPTGKRLFFDYLDGNDPGVHQLAMAGTYTIYTWAYANVAGTYQFQLRANSPDEFTINLGDTVKDAQPGPGAGRIELPGNVDIYRFQAAAGQQVYFDEQGSSDIYDFFWRVVDANGQEIFRQYLHEDDAGARVLALGGTYTIYVWASNNIAGTYQFQIRSPVAAEIAIEGKSAEDLAVEAEEKRKAEEEEQNEEIFLPFIGR